MTASPQDPLHAPTQGTELPASPQGFAKGQGKPWGRCAGKNQSSQPPSFAVPLAHVRAQLTPTHACVSLRKCDSLSCAPAPPSHPSVRLCPPPAPTEHPSLPPPPERFRSVSIDKSGALPRRRCDGVQRVRGCRGAQAHGGVGVRVGRAGWLGPRVTLHICDFPGVWLHTCGISQLCVHGADRACESGCAHMHWCVLCLCRAVGAQGPYSGALGTVWFFLQQCWEGN